MKWSFKIGRVAGIDLFMHWTFLILVGWIALSYWIISKNLAVTAEGVGFILLIFACVVLHELGHALTARRYGIRTRHIILLPIGGVASLERMPEKPAQELAVAIAGPAVNVAIAGLIFLLLMATNGNTSPQQLTTVSGSLLTKLMWVNVILVVFNLLPAFPMDGGRVLRALLATRLEYARATQVAAGVGQGMAILFGFFGLFFNPFLLLIAIFVYLGAEAEAQMVSMRTAFQDVLVREAMMTRFRTLSEDNLLADAVEELLAGSQQDFPVVADGQIAGVLPRNRLFQALSKGELSARVGDVMERECTIAEEHASLDRTFERMRETGCATVPVVRDGRIVGLLTLENIGEWSMIRSALGRDAAAQGLGQAVGGQWWTPNRGTWRSSQLRPE